MASPGPMIGMAEAHHHCAATNTMVLLSTHSTLTQHVRMAPTAA